MPNIHELEHGRLCRYHDDEEFCDCGQLAWSTVDEQKARIAALEAEVASKEFEIKAMISARWGYAHNVIRDGSGRHAEDCPLCRISKLEAALAKAEEALKGVGTFLPIADRSCFCARNGMLHHTTACNNAHEALTAIASVTSDVSGANIAGVTGAASEASIRAARQDTIQEAQK